MGAMVGFVDTDLDLEVQLRDFFKDFPVRATGSTFGKTFHRRISCELLACTFHIHLCHGWPATP